MKKPLFEKIDCIRIPVTNLDEGLAFYNKKLGHKIIWKTDDAIGLKLGNDKSEIVLYTEPMGLEIDFKVNDTMKAVKEFVKAGGSVIKEPFDIPIGKCAIVKDPWDNQYIILDSTKGTFKTDKNNQVIGFKK
jgi:predicted enzyme related to lactoylglutathione lyase